VTVRWIRILVGMLVLASLAVASIPLLVLLDLASGREGYGLCPRGLEGCRTAYTAGPELIAILILLLFGLLALLRVAMRAARGIERRERLAAMSKPGGGGGGGSSGGRTD